MAIFKCKMCGGDLSISADNRIVECEYCGTTQTVPSADNEKKMTLFNRANRLRLNSEFDKAAVLYEQIIAEFPEEAEAYWGLCLCNYGIEYVDDPATGKKIPTCHRASFQKLREDENFNLAMEYSDAIAQRVYRTEAREIDRINEEILSVSKNEKPYDVFICYKETDDVGGRTPDSVMAQEVYDALTAKGYKVFFSRITLEDKLGMQYEPYIFAALNSAKVMLAFGTKYEYFHAVWVKNEWSRFLKLAAKDKTKKLVPVYKDMDPYDLPDEFKALQAQDMGKLGAVQDLVRGVGKLLPDAAASVPTVQPATVASSTTSSLLKRVFMFLEDGKWQEADSYCEKVLDIDPECAEAYLGKLMAELQIRKREQLALKSKPYDTRENCKKASQFDAKIAKELANANARIRNRNTALQKEEIYQEALVYRKAGTAEGYKIAARLFGRISGFKDADVAAEECKAEYEKIEGEHKRAIDAIIEKTEFENKSLLLKIEELKEEKAQIDSRRLDDLQTQIKEGIAQEDMLSVFKVRERKALQEIVNTLTVEADALRKSIEEKKRQIDGEIAKLQNTIQENTDKLRQICNQYQSNNLSIGLNTRFNCPISIGGHHFVALCADGTVVAKRYKRSTLDKDYPDFGQCNVSDWTDIVAVAAGGDHTVGLRADGTVIATGMGLGDRCNVESWADIVSVSAGNFHTVGLCANGTVIAVGYNQDGQCNVTEWTNIVAIAAGSFHTVGLCADGTVVATGKDDCNQCGVDGWTDIISISAGDSHTVGLRSDGTVIATKYTGDYGGPQCDVKEWRDIVTIAAGAAFTVGIRKNGTAVVAGLGYPVSWRNIVAAAAGWGLIIGLRTDGTAVSTKDNSGQCDVNSLTNIMLPTDRDNNNTVQPEKSRQNNEIKVSETDDEHEPRVLLFTTKASPNGKIADALLTKAGIPFKKINTVENPEKATAYGVKTVPTLIVEQGEDTQKYVKLSHIKEFIEKQNRM